MCSNYINYDYYNYMSLSESGHFISFVSYCYIWQLVRVPLYKVFFLSKFENYNILMYYARARIYIMCVCV